MEINFKNSEVKFSDRLIEFIELLCIESRNELAGRLAVNMSLLMDRNEKIAVLKQEIEKGIHVIRELSDKTLKIFFISELLNNKGSVDSYAEMFKEFLRKGMMLFPGEEELYINSVNNIELLLDSSEKNFTSVLVYGDL
ncbi:MAG: hypothetical protein K0B11_07420, partial [Mariniphaga sp.]|nr:hypothetical protein [Mariniphaga sp.]